MALIPCPECGKEISNLSTECVHCGYPYKERRKELLNFKNIHGIRCPKCYAECILQKHHRVSEFSDAPAGREISYLCAECGTEFYIK